jgi:hypothetical protein
LLIVAFNWLLHSFWGTEHFLYSQHWQLPLLLLLAGLTTALFDRSRAWIPWLVAAATAYVGVTNLTILTAIFTRLRTGG